MNLLAYFRVMRPKQWPKNLIAFAPLIFSGKANDVLLFKSASLCFAAFCLVSSSIYIVNDLVDRDADKLHPIPPSASGRLLPAT
jgi:4-hydroxybenzoate polyprenyltransferase